MAKKQLQAKFEGTIFNTPVTIRVYIKENTPKYTVSTNDKLLCQNVNADTMQKALQVLTIDARYKAMPMIDAIESDIKEALEGLQINTTIGSVYINEELREKSKQKQMQNNAKNPLEMLDELLNKL